jgi:hypothetical protein
MNLVCSAALPNEHEPAVDLGEQVIGGMLVCHP